jgi:RNA polymerase sigma factor (sigma-70 family)
MDDARLAALAAEGDERAFEALYDRHHRPLLGFCRHMLGSTEEAEEALQQTFLRAHRALADRGAPGEVRAWLYTIARNRCLSMLSARKPPALDAADVEPAVEGLGSAVERRADLRALLGDIARLPEEQRSALVLSELAGLSHAEIGTVIGVPAGKVKALVHQARSRLMADREARELPCPQVRETLATATGGQLRRGPLRRHLAVCEGCRDYRDAVREQRAALALALPVVPSAGLREAIIGVLGGGGGGGALAALGGGGGLGAKLAVGVVIAGSGGAVAVHEREKPARSAANQVASATAPESPTRAATAPAAVAPRPRRATVRARMLAKLERRRQSAAPRDQHAAPKVNRRATAPGQVKPPNTSARAYAPGQNKTRTKTMGRATAPGQATTKTTGGATAPGQVKKSAATTPRRQKVKPVEREAAPVVLAEAEPYVPPGHAKRDK